MNEDGELLRSLGEFKVHNKMLEVDYMNSPLKFKVRYEHRLMSKHDVKRYKEFEKKIKKHIEYGIDGKRKAAPLLSMMGPRHIILGLKDGHDWWDKHQSVTGVGKWDYNKYQGLEIFLEAQQDMSKFYSNTKTAGYSNSNLEDEIEIAMAEFIKVNDEFISPYFEASKKEEDSFADQVVAVFTDKTTGKYLRLSWAELYDGLKSKDLLKKNIFKTRKDRGGIVDLFELDLQIMAPGGKSIVEFQMDSSDYEHLLGMFGRVTNHRFDVDFMVWVAKSHKLRDELIQLIKELKWKNTVLKKIYLMTTKQSIDGFEYDELDVIDIEKDIKG